MNKADLKILRVIDANFNRSREGLRVCEEVARFVLDDSELSAALKSARHMISNIRKSVSPAIDKALILSRDVVGDVARDLSVRGRARRLDAGDIFAANIQRAKESIRVLEEFFKVIDEKVSMKFQRIRFKVYEIEQARSLSGAGRKTGK